MTEQVFIRQFGYLPENMKQELMTFLEYLLFKYNIQQGTEPASGEPEAGETLLKKQPKAGFLKGTFTLADDFKAPLDDFDQLTN